MKPTRSAKRTETSRRYATGSVSSAGGGDEGAVAAAASCSPHSAQYRWPTTASVPQAPQTGASAAPHSGQNFDSARTGAAHAGQAVTPSAYSAQQRPRRCRRAAAHVRRASGRGSRRWPRARQKEARLTRRCPTNSYGGLERGTFCKPSTPLARNTAPRSRFRSAQLRISAAAVAVALWATLARAAKRLEAVEHVHLAAAPGLEDVVVDVPAELDPSRSRVLAEPLEEQPLALLAAAAAVLLHAAEE